jgi:transaldolase
MPVSTAAVGAIEECIYHGVSVNGTVFFGIPQAVAEAMERGLKRLEGCSVVVEDRMDQQVPDEVIEELIEHIPEYGKSITKMV